MSSRGYTPFNLETLEDVILWVLFDGSVVILRLFMFLGVLGCFLFSLHVALANEGRQTSERHSVFLTYVPYEIFAICVILFVCSSFMPLGNESALDRAFLMGY
uniref:Uncharacterized protein n=1 Tax=Opuntia streptacantha TaxID=393608 RepID=A0A7C9A9H7_OPUST